MRKRVLLACAGMLLPSLAMAQSNVDFSGTLSSVCTLAVPTPGTLGLDSEGRMSSAAGLPATVTILSVGTNTVTVTPPAWVTSPGTYTAGTETAEVSYTGAGGLSLINQAYTASTTNFVVNSLPLTALTVHARIDNSLGFVAGSYTMRVQVTCAP